MTCLDAPIRWNGSATARTRLRLHHTGHFRAILQIRAITPVGILALTG